MPKRSRQPTTPTTSTTVAPISLTTLEAQYPHLFATFKELSDREKAVRDDMGDAVSPGLCTEIMGVDFTAPLAPLPEDAPLKTRSDANKFAMVVWKMLDACESGSVGGDACRMWDVLAAAEDDVLAIGAVGPRFEHLLGLALATVNHGVGSWLERGDPHNGKVHFDAIGGAWKKLLAKPEADLAAEGINAELRTFAIKWCETLKRYLKESKKHHGPYANTFTFNFMVKSRAPSASAASSSSTKRRKTAAA